jgi:regulator of replication initiation timing
MSNINIHDAIVTLDERIETITNDIATLTTQLSSLTTSRDALSNLDNDVINNALNAIASIANDDDANVIDENDNQRTKIAKLLSNNVKPRDIASQLNTHVSYVYTVRRQINDNAIVENVA